MRLFVFNDLFKKGFIKEDTLHAIANDESNKNISVFTDLKFIMYTGIIALTTGVGIIVYKNIDSIGHLALIILLSIITISCFVYCYKKAPAFSTQRPTTINLIRDYILLTGCLLMLILIAYIQFQHNLFGDRWGLATFFPMVILMISAYYFDHLGVLSMGIVNLSAWVGISITPRHFFTDNDFSNTSLIYTSIGLGFLLLYASFFSVKQHIKSHFAFTYKNFGIHLLFIGAIAGEVNFSKYEFLWLGLIIMLSVWQFFNAVKQHSFYFLTVVYLYFYISVSYVVAKWLLQFYKEIYPLYFLFLYFIITAVLSVLLLMRFNKILKQNVHIQ